MMRIKWARLATLSIVSIASMVSVVSMLASRDAFADRDLKTEFSNQGSIANTRHNMTQRSRSGPSPSGNLMTTYRNDYDEVCVYCHTPHAASPVQLPLWNRTIEARTYQTYTSSTLTQAVSAPGINSLACLSCHDGQTAIDSVINMPGSGGYKASQANSVDPDFLSTWRNPSGFETFAHASMQECMSCHSSTAGVVGAGATAFDAFNLTSDLRNDHPVGVAFPFGNSDYNAPAAVRASLRFFDNNGNGIADKNEIRLYDTGDGFEVECASCHDPHGVPSGGAGSTFNATFLRITNAGSAVCLACHNK